jgi:hypothetical protein
LQITLPSSSGLKALVLMHAVLIAIVMAVMVATQPATSLIG